MRKTELTFLFIASIVISFSLLDEIENETKLNIQYIHLDSIHKVIQINDSLVIPVLYDSLIVNKFVSVSEQKQQFINQVLPAILVVKFRMENKSRKVNRIMKKMEIGDSLKLSEAAFVDSMMQQYRAKSYENLLMRMKPHPTSLVLAQAALESGWGSSRFALEGNNLFGIWTSPTDTYVMKSRHRKGEKPIYVKKYMNIAESIDHYFLTIGRNNAYRQFRNKRYEEANVFQLIETLDGYSERGDDYTLQLKKMIEWNDLQKYDQYIIEPQYIIEESILDSYLNLIKKKVYDIRIKSN